MLKTPDNFYSKQQEPVQSCLLALRQYLLAFDVHLTESWKYGMPFFCYREKIFCYLWTDKRTQLPYIGIVDSNKIAHPLLVQQKRTRMKILYIDPGKDLPIKTLRQVLKLALAVRHK
jgi:hypothetical protein